MHRLFEKLITYLIIITFLSNNTMWANGNNHLAPDSKDDLEELVGRVGPRPDDDWGAFNGREPRGKTFREMKFPAGINQQRLEAFWEEYGDFGVIEGIIGAEEKEFIYDIHRQTGCDVKKIRDVNKFNALIKRLNRLLSRLGLPSDTVVRLTSSGKQSLLYHKDDKVLEIHAFLLTDTVDDLTLEFIAHHDERHFFIEGLEPWEEILNTYLDIVYLQELGTSADSIVNTLRDIEGEQGYWRLLARRNDAFYSEVQQREFLMDVIRYLRETEVSTAYMIYESLERDINERAGPLITLWQLAGNKSVPSSMQYLPTMAKVLIKDLGIFKKWIDMEKEVLRKIEESDSPVDLTSLGLDRDWIEIIAFRLWENNKIEVVLYGPDKRRYFSVDKGDSWIDEARFVIGFDEENRRVVLIPKELQDKPWAVQFIREGFSGLLWEVFLDNYKRRRAELINVEVKDLPEQKRFELELRRHRELDNDIKTLKDIYNLIKTRLGSQALLENIDIATRLVRFDVDFWCICASLVQGSDVSELERVLSPTGTQRVAYILNQSRGVRDLPFLPLIGTRRAIQNYMDLLIQLSCNQSGDPSHDILILTILNKLKYLERLSEDKDIYRGLREEYKKYLEEEVLWIYAPLLEFLGLTDLAGQFRDIWFKINNPTDYERIKRKTVEALDIGHKKYIEVQGLVEDVRKRLEDEFFKSGIYGIKVYARVKSPYSIQEKIRSKGYEYPDVKSINDLLGIHIVFPRSEAFEANHETIQWIINSIFPVRDLESHKKSQQYGYEEYDFIGLTNSDLKIEVQVYPSERDYRVYKVGQNAHWVYKLMRESPGQEFDIELLDRLQSRLTGNFKEDFYTVYNALSQWIFAGVIVKDRRDRFKEKVHITRLPRDSIDADIASARRVNALDDKFLGIVDVTGLKLVDGGLKIPEVFQLCTRLRAGVFTIEKGLFAEERFRAIKRKSHRLRTYLLVSEILDSELKDKGAKRGKGLLSDALQHLGYSARFVNSDAGIDMLRSLAKNVGMADEDELYSLIYLISKPEETQWYGRVYKRLMYELTRQEVRGDIEDSEVKRILRENGLKISKDINPRVLLLAFLMTSGLRGREALKARGINYRNEEVVRRLELILPEYGMDSLEQLYARLGIYLEFIFNVLLKYSSTGMPFIRFRISRDIPGIYEKVFRILQLEDIRHGDPVDSGGVISIPFYPPKAFVTSTINRILDGIRDVTGIDMDSVEYISASPSDVVRRRITIAVSRQDKNRLIDIMARLMAELKISFHIGKEGRVKGGVARQEFILEVPEQVSVTIIKEAIIYRMRSQGIDASVEEEAVEMKGIFILPDPMLLLYIGLFIGVIYLIRFILYRIGEWRLIKKMSEPRGDLQVISKEVTFEAKDLGLVLMVNRLVEKLNDPETSVATEVARALRKFGLLNPELITKEVVDIMFEKARDPDTHMYIEEACIQVLAERTRIKDKLAQDIVDRLYKDLDDPYRAKRLTAVKVLREVASVNIDAISEEILERLYGRSEDDEYAILALCRITIGNPPLISQKIVERLCEGVEKLGVVRKEYILKVLEKLVAERPELISMERVYGLYDRFNIGGEYEHPLAKMVLRGIHKGDYSLITQETIEILYKTLKERDTFRCKSAVNAMVEIARVKEEFAQDIVDRLYRKLNDRNYNILFILFYIPESAPKVRKVCAIGLGKIAVFRPNLITVRIVRRLYKRLNDRYSYVRDASAGALAEIASVRPELINKKIVHRLYKRSAIDALIKIVRIRNEFAKDVVDWAYEGLESRIKDRKITAIRVIGEMASVRPDLITRDMVNSLYEKLNSKYIFIVAKALGKIADARPDLMTQDIVERLLEEVNDRSSQHGFDYHIIPEVLGKIAMVRPELFTIDMEYNLYKKLDDPDYRIRANAAQILGEIEKGRPVISPKGFTQFLQDTEKGVGLEEGDLKYGLMMLYGLSSSSDIYCLNEIRKKIEENRDYRKTSLLVKLAYSYLRESRFDEFRRIIMENKESKIEDLLVILRERLIEIIGIKEDISGKIRDGKKGITRLLRIATEHPALAIYIIDKVIVTLQYLRQGIGTDIGLSMADFEETRQQYSRFRDTLVLILSNPEIDILTKRNLVRSIPFGETGEIDVLRYQVLHFVQGMTQSDSNQGVLGFLRVSLHNLGETFNKGISALRVYREWVASDGTRGADILEGLGYTLTDSDRVPPSRKSEVLLICDTILSTLNAMSGERGLDKTRSMVRNWDASDTFLVEDRELIGRLIAQSGTGDAQNVLEIIISARERLRDMINNSTGEELIYLFKLGHRLELLFYPAYSRGDLSDIREFIGLLITLLNDSILNGYMPESLGNVKKELEQLKDCFEEGRDSYLRLYSIVKRIERLLSEKIEEFISRYNSHAVKTAKAINVSERQRVWVEDFCSNLFRGDTVFLLSQLLINSKGAIMEKAGITGWQVVVGGRMEGRLHYIEDVSRLSEVKDDEILVIPALPLDGLPTMNVRGIITFSEDSVLSHPAIRIRQHGIPFAVCPDKEILEPWFGKEVSIDVSGHGVKIKKGVTASKKAHPKKKASVSIPTAVTTGDIIILPPQYTPNTVGNKAFRLNEIDQGNIKTRHITLGFSLYEHILNLPENRGKKKEIESLVIPEGLLRNIQLSIIKNIGSGLVFLRSSTNAEDLAGYSGAGLYDSFGAVDPMDLGKLERYIKKVLASVRNERAFRDRDANGIEHSDVHMAVLIHEMISPEYGFVVHTINPINGLQDEVVIEIVQGLGETLVSGNYPGLPHGFIYNRRDGTIKLISYANKDKKLVLENGRIVEKTVDYTEDIFVQGPSKWEEIISRIARAAIGLEEKFGSGQDIEGCIVMEDGEYKFSFIQSRDQQKERGEDKTPFDSPTDARALVTRLLSVIRTQADVCRLDNKELVLAIDTDIGNLKDYAGELLKELTQLQDRLKGEGLDNVRILIGEGTSLKAQMDSYLRDAEKAGRGFIISAVLKSDNLEHKLYENIKDKIRITAVSDTDTTAYIPVISILELSIKRALGNSIDEIIKEYRLLPNVEDIIERDGILTIIILPKPEPISVEQLRERYTYEAQVLSSA